MGFLLGKDFMIYFDRQTVNGTERVPLCYAQNVTITSNIETLEATKPKNSAWRNFYPGMTDYTISCEGLINTSEDSFSPDEMLDLILSRTSIKWMAKDINYPLKQYSGTLLPTSLSLDSSYDTIDTFSFSAQGDGELVKRVIIPGDTGSVFFGMQDNSDDPSDFSNSIVTDPNEDITIPYGTPVGPKFFWMWHTINANQKLKYKDLGDINNAGDIGGLTNLFKNKILTVGGNQGILYMCNWATEFSGLQNVLFYNDPIVPNPVNPPTNVTPTYVINLDATITVTVTWTHSVTPDPKTYRVRIIDIDAASTDYQDTLLAGQHSIVFTGIPGHNYQIAVRTETPTGSSDWTSDVALSLPAPNNRYPVTVLAGGTIWSDGGWTAAAGTSVNVDTTILINVTLRDGGGTIIFNGPVQITNGSNNGFAQAGANSGTIVDSSLTINSITPSNSSTQNYIF